MLTSRKLKIAGVSPLFMTKAEGKFAADDGGFAPAVIPWTKGKRVDIVDDRNKTFLSVSFMSHSAKFIILDNLVCRILWICPINSEFSNFVVTP